MKEDLSVFLCIHDKRGDEFCEQCGDTRIEKKQFDYKGSTNTLTVIRTSPSVKVMGLRGLKRCKVCGGNFCNCTPNFDKKLFYGISIRDRVIEWLDKWRLIR